MGNKLHKSDRQGYDFWFGEDSSKKKDKVKTKKFKYKGKKGRYKTRLSNTIESIDPCFKSLMFDNDEDKIKEFARFVIEDEDNEADICLDKINADSISFYDEGMNKIFSKKCKDLDDINKVIEKAIKFKKTHKKKERLAKLRNEKDRGLAILLNPKTYNKKYLDKSKYRKELKDLAKRETEELKEIKRLGFIDCSIQGYEKRRKMMEKRMDNVLSDAFSQKYFLEE